MSKRLNLAGQRFGKLTTMKYAGEDKWSNSQFLCLCDCGTEVIVKGSCLKSGHTKSCGCYKREKASEIHRLNLIDQKFGYLKVLKGVGTNKRGDFLWLCECDCGNKVIVRGAALTFGCTKSCGCLRKERVSEACRSNLIRQKFGRLTVIKFSHIGEHRNSYWICKCDCGNEIIISGNHLKSRITKSCGCLQKEIAIKMGKNKIGKNNPSFKHGLSHTKAYKNQKSSEHKAQRKNQTPPDVDLEKIAYIYQVCEAMNQVNEERYEMDHIKPISKGGLHHQDNLQILKRSLNGEKNAKWPLTEGEKIKYKGIILKDLEKRVSINTT